MQIKIKHILSIVALSTILLTGCSKLLDLKPSDAIPTNTTLSTISGLQSALTGTYSLMQSVSYYGRNMYAISDISSDDIYISSSNSGRFYTSYRRKFTTTDPDITNLWNAIYRVVLGANNIINSVDNVPGDAVTKNSIKGQALFIRALAYFDLCRVFGQPYIQNNGGNLGVPLVLKFDAFATPARNTVAEVYTQIITDLNSAKTLLSNTGVNDKFTASQYAASALLSRVYLYKGDNNNAITEATNVITAGYTLTPPTALATFYSTPGTAEEIFTLRFAAVQTNGADNLGNIYLLFGGAGYGDFRISPSLINIFDLANDLRYKNYISSFSTSPIEYQSNKFLGQEGIQGLHSPKLLRLAEVLLNRAEAYAKKGDDAHALIDLNMIRQVRGLAPLATAPLDSILVERRREFMFEGQRFYDLMRNDSTMVRNPCRPVDESGNPLDIGGVNCIVAPESSISVAPIPQNEINVNHHIEQNPGY